MKHGKSLMVVEAERKNSRNKEGERERESDAF